MNSTATRPSAKENAGAATTPLPTPLNDTTANSTTKVRKARAKQDGLIITFRITDPDEIDKLNNLAKRDRRTPENYVSLLTYEHLLGHAPINRADEKASGVV